MFCCCFKQKSVNIYPKYSIKTNVSEDSACGSPSPRGFAMGNIDRTIQQVYSTVVTIGYTEGNGSYNSESMSERNLNDIPIDNIYVSDIENSPGGKSCITDCGSQYMSEGSYYSIETSVSEIISPNSLQSST